MPKPTKLHVKGRATSIQKPYKVDKDSDNADPEESIRQFQLELCWCIQQLERSLTEKKGNEKQMQEAWKVLTVLKNNNQPMIRKRQLMRTHFGDYRAKMAAEEKKLAKMASKIKISETPDKPKATFLRKSAFLTTGDNSFRFNFDLAPEKVDNGNTSKEKSAETSSIDGNNKRDEASNTGNVNEDNSKRFKFSFSDSQFKFNFNVDNL
ncbi:hypothetical protein K1T71_013870 [Dendrolimus kikuchii]|uniref:Uncharacterized protein n=1 Tax=Dendrolimus kikuchii TaxID=765133 RepID=A0ACC1CGA2_9NEOP|nr:hypothetical protein K1T71_013870 [Dendrolimus kikuchii]